MLVNATPERPLASREGPVTGAEIVIRTLEDEGVEVCFGMPGGAILPIYDAMARGSTLRHVLVRHEQGAGHMAQGYARAGGGIGVVLATSGPGATNLVTPIADAQMDSTALVCITGQVRTDVIGTDAFQECAIADVVRPLVKACWQVRDPTELAGTLRAALAIARAGRPGPVLVDIPRDVQEATLDRPSVAVPFTLVEAPSPSREDAERIARELREARRPVLYVGGGAQSAASAVLALAERARAPVVTTLMGKGAFPESHPLFAGCPGMHGTRAANWTLNRADLIIAAGARFDDRVTGRLDAFAPAARVVHIDVDARELGKIRRPDVAVHADLAATLDRVGELEVAGERDAWLAQVDGWRARFPLGYAPAPPGGALKPQHVLERLAVEAARLDDVVFTTGVGQHQMWAMQYLPMDRPRSFITSGGLGTMGYGLPAALGARLARPGATVVCVDGDGSFQMTLQELATAVAERVPVVVVILNNRRLGMVDQWQTMFYDERRSASDLHAGMPSFAAIARAYGAAGIEISTPAELDAGLTTALRADGPVVLDVHVEAREACFPMIVPSGAAVDQVEWCA